MCVLMCKELQRTKIFKRKDSDSTFLRVKNAVNSAFVADFALVASVRFALRSSSTTKAGKCCRRKGKINAGDYLDASSWLGGSSGEGGGLGGGEATAWLERDLQTWFTILQTFASNVTDRFVKLLYLGGTTG